MNPLPPVVAMFSKDESDRNYDTTKDSTTIDPKDSIRNNSKDPIINPRSHYYIHPDKNPGSILVVPLLDDDNYNNLSKSMHNALTLKQKTVFINGTLPNPYFNDFNFDLWD